MPEHTRLKNIDSPTFCTKDGATPIPDRSSGWFAVGFAGKNLQIPGSRCRVAAGSFLEFSQASAGEKNDDHETNQRTQARCLHAVELEAKQSRQGLLVNKAGRGCS
jgi:hypothetical protein